MEMLLALMIAFLFFVLLVALLSPSPYPMPGATIIISQPPDSPVRFLLGLLFLMAAALLLFLPERI